MGKEKILIVNGDKYVRDTLAQCLSKDYDVYTSESFMKALKIYKDEKFYTVVTEIDTPETKGVEVISKLQQLKSDVPIIVVTTHRSVKIAVEAMKAGAYDYITKPFNTDELKLVILHALERKKLQDEVKEKKIYEELAITDGLTGVYNRRYFDELIRREESRAKRYPQKFSLLMADIDDFKKYNDIYGHPSGDALLRSLAGIFLSKIRTTDFVARYGGEEFAIIAPHTDKKNASVLGARLVDIINNQTFTLSDSIAAKITISVGLATFEQDAATKEDLIQKADQALYQAKNLGKNRVCLFGEP